MAGWFRVHDNLNAADRNGRQRHRSEHGNDSAPVVKLESVLRHSRCLLALQLRRRHSLRHGVAVRPCGRKVVLDIHERRERPAHMPLDVVGQHAEEVVRLHAVGRAVVDGPHEDVDALNGASCRI